MLGVTLIAVLLYAPFDDEASLMNRSATSPPSQQSAAAVPSAVGAAALPALLDGYTERVQGIAGIDRGCVVLEAVDVRFVFGSIDIQVPFMQYRTRVRDAVEPVKNEVEQLKSRDRDPDSDALDLIHAKHLERVRTAIDAAQAELMSALGADAAARQRMIRHALWRSIRDESDTIGFDVGMLYEDDSEATSMKLRAALEAHPIIAANVRELLKAHDARVGPVRDASIATHRAAFTPNKARSAAQTERLATSLIGLRESNEALLDALSACARDCGESTLAFEWRARAFKLRDARLLPRSDLLDTFDAARIIGDAVDEAAMCDARRHALEQRDAAMSDLLSSYSKCKQTLNRHGPNSDDAERVLRRFAECVEQWEKCEQRIAASLKGQLRDPAGRAALAIDGYLEGQDALAQEHWRDLLQFWTSFVKDQRTVK